MVYLLPVELHLPVLGYLHPGHPLDEVLQHGVGTNPECGGVELHGVLLHDNGVADVADHGGLEVVFVDLELDCPDVDAAVPEIPLLDVRLVAHHLHMEDIAAERDLLQLGLPFRIGKGEVGDGGVLGGNHIDRSEGDGFSAEGVQDGNLDLGHAGAGQVVIHDDYLGPCAKRKA